MLPRSPQFQFAHGHHFCTQYELHCQVCEINSKKKWNYFIIQTHPSLPLRLKKTWEKASQKPLQEYEKLEVSMGGKKIIHKFWNSLAIKLLFETHSGKWTPATTSRTTEMRWKHYRFVLMQEKRKIRGIIFLVNLSFPKKKKKIRRSPSSPSSVCW